MLLATTTECGHLDACLGRRFASIQAPSPTGWPNSTARSAYSRCPLGIAERLLTTSPCRAGTGLRARRSIAAMQVLANALPGVRELRGPLVAGYLWLLFIWMLLTPDLDHRPSSSA